MSPPAAPSNSGSANRKRQDRERQTRDHRSDEEKATAASSNKKRAKFEGGAKEGAGEGGGYQSKNKRPGSSVGPNFHNKPLTTVEKTERNRRKKLKKRKQQQKNAPPSAPGLSSGVANGSVRDYAADLAEYLAEWRNRAAPDSEWKFNKKLQMYCIMNFLNNSLISDELYIALMPYLMSVEGKGLVSIEDLCDQCLGAEESAVDADGAVGDRARARQIKDILLQCK